MSLLSAAPGSLKDNLYFSEAYDASQEDKSPCQSPYLVCKQGAQFS